MTNDAHHHFIDHKYAVSFDGTFDLNQTSTTSKKEDKEKLNKSLAKSTEKLSGLQEVLYAHDKYSVLCLFQAMDAAGKDSTIRAVFTGVNPAGFQVFSFKKPSEEALDHDFLWRSARRLPERGRIGIFNRSYYEEVLIVRVHEAILESQKLPSPLLENHVWEDRYHSIREHELHMAKNGMVILKFFLNVSKEEQKERFLSRLEVPDKNWKFNSGDVEERKHWDTYMEAYQEALQQTSRPWAPWYAIPADSKRFMRATVADIIVKTLQQLPLHYPKVSDEESKDFDKYKKLLEKE